MQYFHFLWLGMRTSTKKGLSTHPLQQQVPDQTCQKCMLKLSTIDVEQEIHFEGNMIVMGLLP